MYLEGATWTWTCLYIYIFVEGGNLRHLVTGWLSTTAAVYCASLVLIARRLVDRCVAYAYLAVASCENHVVGDASTHCWLVPVLASCQCWH